MDDRARPSPFAMRVLVAYLAVDGLLRAGLLVHDWVRAGAPPLDLYFRAVVLLFYLLIGIQILMRTAAGRIWAAVFFLLYATLELVKYSAQPHLWLAIGLGGRVRTIASVAAYLGFATFLLGRRAREFLHG